MNTLNRYAVSVNRAQCIHSAYHLNSLNISFIFYVTAFNYKLHLKKNWMNKIPFHEH